MNKCHTHKKVKKCKSQKLESLEEKSYDSSDQKICRQVMNRQSMQDNSFCMLTKKENNGLKNLANTNT